MKALIPKRFFLWHQFKTVSKLARPLRFKPEFLQMPLEKLPSELRELRPGFGCDGYKRGFNFSSLKEKPRIALRAFSLLFKGTLQLVTMVMIRI